MINREIIAYLKLAHGSFNGLVFLLFCYQGMMGKKIRRTRKEGRPHDVALIKRHRMNGPILALLGMAGYIAGLTIGFLDHGLTFKYPLHLGVGSVIFVTIVLIFFVSKQIKGHDSHWRDLHFYLGLLLLGLYCAQIFTGLGILL